MIYLYCDGQKKAMHLPSIIVQTQQGRLIAVDLLRDTPIPSRTTTGTPRSTTSCDGSRLNRMAICGRTHTHHDARTQGGCRSRHYPIPPMQSSLHCEPRGRGGEELERLTLQNQMATNTGEDDDRRSAHDKRRNGTPSPRLH